MANRILKSQNSKYMNQQVIKLVQQINTFGDMKLKGLKIDLFQWCFGIHIGDCNITVAINYIFSLIWRCYSPKRDVLD